MARENESLRSHCAVKKSKPKSTMTDMLSVEKTPGNNFCNRKQMKLNNTAWKEWDSVQENVKNGEGNTSNKAY